MLTLAEFAQPATALAEVPFEVTVGIGFDKETRDIPSRRLPVIGRGARDTSKVVPVVDTQLSNDFRGFV
jgi:hypothetical protein